MGGPYRIVCQRSITVGAAQTAGNIIFRSRVAPFQEMGKKHLSGFKSD